MKDTYFLYSIAILAVFGITTGECPSLRIHRRLVSHPGNSCLGWRMEVSKKNGIVLIFS